MAVEAKRNALTVDGSDGGVALQSLTQPGLVGNTSGRQGLVDCEYCTVTLAGSAPTIAANVGANWLSRGTVD